MIPYFLIFCTFLLPIKKRNINKMYFSILLIFAIIRWDVGMDYRWYYSLAENRNLNQIPLFFDEKIIHKYIELVGSWGYLRNEFFLRGISKIIWNFNLFSQTIFIFYGVIILYFIKKSLDNLKIYNKYVWMFFYSFPYFYLLSLNLLRQWAAISIVFYAYKYIKERNIKKYLFFIFMASLCHKTALFMIILYFLSYINFSKKFHMILFISNFIFIKLFIYIIFNFRIPFIGKYLGYITDKVIVGGTKMYYVILILYILLLCKIIKYKRIPLEYSISIIGCYIYISLISFGELGIRMSIYFLVFLLILVNKYTEKNIFKKLVVTMVSLIFIIGILFIDLKKERQEYIPYQTIFFNKEFTK